MKWMPRENDFVHPINPWCSIHTRERLGIAPGKHQVREIQLAFLVMNHWQKPAFSKDGYHPGSKAFFQTWQWQGLPLFPGWRDHMWIQKDNRSSIAGKNFHYQNLSRAHVPCLQRS